MKVNDEFSSAAAPALASSANTAAIASHTDSDSLDGPGPGAAGVADEAVPAANTTSVDDYYEDWQLPPREWRRSRRKLLLTWTRQ